MPFGIWKTFDDSKYNFPDLLSKDGSTHLLVYLRHLKMTLIIQELSDNKK